MAEYRGEGMRAVVEAVELSPVAAKDVCPLTGNEAIARGAWEAGGKVAAAYPDTPSAEILETLGTLLQLGSERVTNIVALGGLVALSGICDQKRIEQAVRADAPRGFLDLNMDALKAGYAMQLQADAGAAVGT